MLGCRVVYTEDSPPQVIPAEQAELRIDADRAFRSPAFGRLRGLQEALKARYGFLTGDVNWAAT